MSLTKKQMNDMLRAELYSFNIVNRKVEEIIESRRKAVSFEDNINAVLIKKKTMKNVKNFSSPLTRMGA